MVAFGSLLLSLLATTALATPLLETRHKKPECLSDKEADKLVAVWLSFWSSGVVKTIADLKPYVTKDVINEEYTFGPPNVGIESLLAATTFVDPVVTNVLEFNLDTFHTCDRIATRWGYTGKTTGVNSTVPAGSPISIYGIEMLTVDLESRKISKSSSSADWINLARGLGQTVIV